MRDLITRFLISSGIDPVYFVTLLVDIVAIVFAGKLKRGLTVTQRSFYKAIILVAVLLTAGVLAKIFGFITSWKDLKSLWTT